MPYKTEHWKLAVIEHDRASKRIKEFFTKIWADDIILHDVNWSRSQTKKGIIKETPDLGKQKGKILTLYGDGGYHHYTYGLCLKVAKRKSKDYIYVHADNHTDARKCDDPIGCGSFVEDITDKPRAKDILLLGTTYGSNEKNRTIVTVETLTSKNAKEDLRKALKAKQQKDVYASFDLDVLNGIEITTSYGTGNLSLENLLDAIEVISEEKNIISADILGLTGRIKRHDIDLEYTEPISLLTYAVLAAKITGKDTKELEKLRGYFKNKEVYADNLRERVLLREEFRKITEQLKV